ncbi:transglutaminaseTgpA domain-containing protein [Litorilituus lipolyticus]|uniref:DUF3488 domain-containing protein n=1 Tax=Litorilituus lipolyticus TaxID=2491017 RepID=A0A502KX64_9GAMM|nr:DUF3488 and transglutaminase-like domain-containing protein [Litorilituus lipolyticus]TPH12837.1 DUF3488 domain-containing protein [Litorilituus lipolyticus]
MKITHLFNKLLVKQAVSKPKFYLTRSNAWLLWLSQLLNIALLGFELAYWMLAIILLCFCLQALRIQQNVKPDHPNPVNSQLNWLALKTVSPMVLLIFALLGCIAIAVTAKSFGILISMIHLLSFSYILKAFELRSRKDFYQLILLGFFVLASSLIFTQNLYFSILAFAVLMINLLVLLQYFSPSNRVFKNSKLQFLLLAQSSVLAVLLFLFFPRLSPFWQVPLAKSAQTGLSATVQPGDIAKLARSSELAFRVEFSEDTIPAYSQLYWRALVLDKYDGRKWSKSNEKNIWGLALFQKELKGLETLASDEAISYRVTVEPSFQPWLFALPVARTAETGIDLLPDYTLKSKRIVSQTQSYSVTSYVNQAKLRPLTKTEQRINLSYPVGSNPKLEALGAQLREQFQSPQDRALAVLTRFNELNYYYTLEPPLLVNNSLDQFFFDTKAGFCSHYASAFTFLMRSAGVPSRMVTGYMGGEINRLNAKGGSKGHLNIYQYDAHAWSEIWLKGIGWVRYDPTASVDPSRVNQGFSERLAEQRDNLDNNFFSLQSFKHFAWINNLRLTLDLLDYQWTKLVIGYSAQKQYELIKRWFGQVQSWTFGLIMVSSIVLVLLLLFFINIYLSKVRIKAKERTPWGALYSKSLTLLTKKGLTKSPDETVNHFAKQVALKFPKISKTFYKLSHLFNQLNYQQISHEQQLVLLSKMKNEFKSLNQQVNKLSYKN